MMRARVFVKSGASKPRSFLIGLFVCLLLIDTGKGVSQQKVPISKEEMRERVATIIRESLEKSEFSLTDGTKISIRPTLPMEAYEEIKRYGDDAVPILAEYLGPENNREKPLAMRLLSSMGGERIVEPLKKVIQSDPSSGTRELALNWITQAPWDLAYPVIREAAEKDSDRRVRKVARELLIQYAPK